MIPGASARRAALLVAAVTALATLLAPLVAEAPAQAAAATERHLTVRVPESPSSSTRIALDAELYTPDRTPAPAVLLAHGFGQDRHALDGTARRLRGEGFVVLAYSARGFGASGGRIGLDSLDGEVPDARRMIDVLDRDPAVQHRGGDPVVGVVGGSYGGALALMTGATDPRVDTVVAAITWSDLADALAPPSAGAPSGGTSERDFKVGWASRLFGAGIAGTTAPCGRFTAAFCALYRRLVTGGAATAADLALLARSSPATVLSGMRASTLLLQGEQDRLFGLDQSDENARLIAAAGAPVQVRWFDGGHDGGGTAGTNAVVDDWLRDRLVRRTPPPRRFELDVPASATAFGEHRTAARYPGLDGPGTAVALSDPAATVVNPPGGRPQSVTGVPGLDGTSAVGRNAGRLLGAGNPPEEAASFASAPLGDPALLAGAARVRLRVTPEDGSPSTAVLYAQLTVRTGDAERALPGGVAPIRFALPAGGADVDVALPATAWDLAPGDRVVLTVRTSDSQFVGSTEPAALRVAVAGPLRLPSVVVVAATRSGGQPAPGVLAGIAAALLAAALLLALAVLVDRRAARLGRPAVQEVAPLVITGLTKRFRSGSLAVDDVAFSARSGRVLGLLGENGAGKTTTLRMVAGLIRPDAGEVRLFGARVAPGSPALARLGCFIEGPGFLPQLSGRRNLELYWAATGRPRSEARFTEVLAVADLGAAIRRPVRGYSQGMRQRLAIAQAMLGLPELLVLDEPTNGLDPPQITALRGVLRDYAAAGRTVVVSSHLLAEVERTCDDVVVMSHGRVVATGTVAEVAGEADVLLIGTDDVPGAVGALTAAGFADAEAAEDGVRVRLDGRSVADAVAAVTAAGVGVVDLQRGRRLEEAFLDLIGATEPSA